MHCTSFVSNARSRRNFFLISALFFTLSPLAACANNLSLSPESPLVTAILSKTVSLPAATSQSRQAQSFPTSTPPTTSRVTTLPLASFHGVPLACMHQAAARYGLRSDILLAILNTEGGRPGTVAYDSNGTEDLGPAQVNTCHLPTLSLYGYTFTTLADNPCANIEASAWIFSRCLAETGNLLNAAACYNAGSHPWLAWQSGYVQRFAAALGDPISVLQTPQFPQKPAAIPAHLILWSAKTNNDF